MKKKMNRKLFLFLALCLTAAAILPVCTALAKAADPYSVLENETDNLSADEYDGYIVKLKASAPSYAVSSFEDNEVGLQEIQYLEDCYTADSVTEIENAVDTKYIEYIEPNYKRKMLDYEADSETEPNDYYYTSGDQWNLRALNVGKAWAYGLEGQDLDDSIDMDKDGIADNDPIVVAVIDSGLKEKHEDIDWDRIIPGRSFVKSDTDNPENTDDTLGHGTFCTGIIMASKDNETGISGICQNVYVMPLKVFEGRTTADSIIANAISYAVQQKNTFDQTNGRQGTNISVINMSLGGEQYSSSLKTACEDALAAGIIVVCAAGNDGDTRAGYPAQFTMGVGSTGYHNGVSEDDYPKDGNSDEKALWENQVSGFSQRLSAQNGAGYDKKVWVTAPGSTITSTYCQSTASYKTSSGTSFSCPEVVALAAIAKGIDNSLDQTKLMNLLKETAVFTESGEGLINGQDIGYGWGVVDFAAFLDKLIGEQTGEATLTVQVKNEAGTPLESASYEIYTIVQQNGKDVKGELLQPNTDGSYTLQRGVRYIYTAQAPKYDTAEGIFSAITENKNLTITLQGQTYRTSFVIKNTKGEAVENPDIKVYKSNGSQISRNADGTFGTRNGKYSYAVTADGYFETTGDFTVDDAADNTLSNGKTIDVVMNGDIDVCTTEFRVLNENSVNITAKATILLTDENGELIEEYKDGSYKLEPGNYQYKVSADKYGDESGSFTVTADEKGGRITRCLYLENKASHVYINILTLSAKGIAEVKNCMGEIMEPVDTNHYLLTGGTYYYTVKAKSYNTYTGSFVVKGQTLNVDLEMTKGSAVIDDGTTADDGTPYIVISNSRVYAADLAPFAEDKGGINGVTLKTAVQNFAVCSRPIESVDIYTENMSFNITDIENSLLTWDEKGSLQLNLTENTTDIFAEDIINNPTVLKINFHSHVYKTEITKKATCTEKGKITDICACGDVFETEIAALGHNYVNDICSRCGSEKPDPSDVYNEQKITVYDANGTPAKELGSVTVAEMKKYTKTQNFTMVDNSAGQTKTHLCKGIALTDFFANFFGDYCLTGLQVVSASNGYRISLSADQMKETMVIWLMDGELTNSDANGLRLAVNGGTSSTWLYSPGEFHITFAASHNYVLTTAKDATCTEDGCRESTCSRCGAVKREILQAKGHDYVYSAVTAPTAETEGVLQGVCSRSSDHRTAEIALPALSENDYTLEIIKAVTPTADGIYRYTWKETAYGEISFDLRIAHNRGTVVLVNSADYGAAPNGYNLIKYTPESKQAGVKYQYDGNDMFYCQTTGKYLYFASFDVAKADVLEKITEAAGTAPNIARSGDTNGNGEIRIDDAQLIYDLYTGYQGYAEDMNFVKVPMLYRLQADANGNGAADTLDVAFVISLILGRN